MKCSMRETNTFILYKDLKKINSSLFQHSGLKQRLLSTLFLEAKHD